MRRFKLRRAGTKNYMYINDAGPFFQSSLMTALNPDKSGDDPAVTPEEYAILKAGKDNRASADLNDDMRQYNALENDAFARLMRRLNQGFTQAGVRLNKTQWFGPGQGAQKWFYENHVITRKTLESVTPWQVLDDVRGTYYGGWFEVMAHGHIPGISWEYDINSAYPAIICKLPCLLHGSWQHRSRDGKNRTYKASDGSQEDILEWIHKRNHPKTSVPAGIPKIKPGQWRFIYAHVEGSDPYIGTMLHRSRADETSIFRPDHTTGWFWQHELESAVRAGLIDTVECLEWWTYTACDCPPPLNGVERLYLDRLKIGKNTPQGKAYKLLYNSMYGKFAQVVGSGKYENRIYASLITSGCRTQITDAIASHPMKTSGVVMVATDAVYFRAEHPGLVISNRLGEWEGKEKLNLTIFKPGVYWDDKARRDIDRDITPEFKSRGVSAKDMAASIAYIDDQFRAWDGIYPQNDEAWPKVVISGGFASTTCLEALNGSDDRWENAGKIGHDTLQHGCSGCSGQHQIQYSRPRYKDMGKRDPGCFDGDIYRSIPRRLPVGYYTDNGKWERSYMWHEQMPAPPSDTAFTDDAPLGTQASELLGMMGRGSREEEL